MNDVFNLIETALAVLSGDPSVDLAAILLLFARFFAFALMIPALRPISLRVALSAGLALLFFPLIPASPDGIGFWLNLPKEIVVGLAFGFSVGLMFEAAAAAGKLIDIQIDKRLNTAGGVDRFKTLYLLLAIVLFWTSGASNFVIEGLANTLVAFPVDGFANFMSSDGFGITTVSGTVALFFVSAVSVALPVAMTLIAMEFVFAMAERAVPGMESFLKGISPTLVLAVVTAALVTQVVLSRLQSVFEDFVEMVFRFPGVSS